MTCICPYAPPLTLPGPDTRTVVVNAQSLYVSGYDRDGLAALTLTDETAHVPLALGAPVEGGAPGGLVRIPLDAPLVADHSYVLDVTRAGTVMALAAFAASADMDTTLPPIPAVADLDLAVATYADGLALSCGAPLGGVGGTLSSLEPGTVLVIRLAQVGGAVIERVVPSDAHALATLGSGSCAIATPLVAGAMYDVDISARDLAGNESAARHARVVARDCGVVARYADVTAASECVFDQGPPVGSPGVDGAPEDSGEDGGCAASSGATRRGGARGVVLLAAGLVVMARRRRRREVRS